MMQCKRATRLASESLERDLGTGENLGLKLHLAMCPACRNFYRQMSELRRIARHYAKEEAGEQGTGNPDDHR